MSLAVLIPAAGASSRMQGRDKLVMPVGGQPLLRRQVARALGLGAPVVVGLPSPNHPYHTGRAAALHGLPITALNVPNAQAGLGHTLRNCLAACGPQIDQIAIVLPDLVDLTLDDLVSVVGAGTARGYDAATDTPGHPVSLTGAALAAFHEIADADDAPRQIFKAHPPSLVPLPAGHAVRDLDTPMDWAAWQKDQS